MQDGSPIFIETFLRVKNYEETVEICASRIKDDFAYLQGKSFAQINREMEEATLGAHQEEGILTFLLEMEDMSEKEWGKLFVFFMAAVVLSAEIMGVNPFNQDGVEKYKQKMFQRLRMDGR